MITPQDIEKLATLSRIKVTDSEKADLAKDIGSVLKYIDQIKEATGDMDSTPIPGAVHNVYREDIVKDSSPEERERLLAEAPQREGDFVAVKKIIAQD